MLNCSMLIFITSSFLVDFPFLFFSLKRNVRCRLRIVHRVARPRVRMRHEPAYNNNHNNKLMRGYHNAFEWDPYIGRIATQLTVKVVCSVVGFRLYTVHWTQRHKETHRRVASIWIKHVFAIWIAEKLFCYFKTVSRSPCRCDSRSLNAPPMDNYTKL